MVLFVRIFVRAVLLLMLGPLMAGAADQNGLKAERLAPGVYVLPGVPGSPSLENAGRVGNLGFLVGSKGIVVIDTGSSFLRAEELETAIRRVSRKPIVAVLITHPAQEFLFGNAWFHAAHIPIWADTRTPQLMAARCQHCLETLEGLLGRERMRGTSLVLPEGRAFDGQTMQLGGRRIRIVPGPQGTVPGNLLIVDEATGVAFVGALISVGRVPGTQDTRPEEWIRALSCLESPELRQIVPAFGPILKNHRQIEHASEDFQAYLRALDKTARRLYAAQTKLADLEPLGDLPAFKDWDNYADNHPRNVFYRFLQLESDDLLSH